MVNYSGYWLMDLIVKIAFDRSGLQTSHAKSRVIQTRFLKLI